MDKSTAKTLHVIAFVLVIIGALNWGLYGLLNINLISLIFSAWPLIEKLVYLLVGVSAIYLLGTHASDCKMCSMKKK